MKIILFVFVFITGKIIFGQGKERFQIKENKSGYFIYDDSAGIRTRTFRSVRTMFTFFYAMDNKMQIWIYSQKTGNLLFKKVSAAVNYYDNSIQVIAKGKTFWLMPDETITYSIPEVSIFRGVCGTVTHVKTEFVRENDSSYLKTQTSYLGEDYPITKLNITSKIGSNTLTFLNNYTTNEFSVNDEIFNKFLDNDVFIETMPNGKINIIRLGLVSGIVTKELFVTEADTCYSPTKHLFFAKFSPFIFRKNGLFGYYPMMKDAKYKWINEFNGFFARFELPNGKKGWLAVYGREFMDE